MGYQSGTADCGSRRARSGTRRPAPGAGPPTAVVSGGADGALAVRAFAVLFGFAFVVVLAFAVVVFFAVVFFAAVLLAAGFFAAVVLVVAAFFVVLRGCGRWPASSSPTSTSQPW